MFNDYDVPQIAELFVGKARGLASAITEAADRVQAAQPDALKEVFETELGVVQHLLIDENVAQETLSALFFSDQENRRRRLIANAKKE